MYKIETSVSVDDGSLIYSNQNNVLVIDSVHKQIKFNVDVENHFGGNCLYSESAFSTTGKSKWSKLVDDYNYRLMVSEKYYDIPTMYRDRKPISFMKTAAFSMTIETIKEYIKNK